MNRAEFKKADCQKVLMQLDSYLSHQLAGAALLEIANHLEHCPECLQVCRARGDLKIRLKKALNREAAPNDLKDQIWMRIHHERPCWLRRLFRLLCP
ncbi:MAG: zf-HC2 domain-containing protein [Acidobacteriota bacterium]